MCTFMLNINISAIFEYLTQNVDSVFSKLEQVTSFRSLRIFLSHKIYIFLFLQVLILYVHVTQSFELLYRKTLHTIYYYHFNNN